MLKRILPALFFFAISATALAQSGTIKITLIDKDTKEGVPFANVVAFSNGVQAGGATTDFNGDATIKPLNPGVYVIKVSYVGYQPVEVTGVIVSSDKTTYQPPIEMGKGVELKAVIIKYDKPLIRPDNVQGGTVTKEEFQRMASTSIADAAGLTGGTFQSDQGGAIYMRGSRADATDVYVDGIRAIGSAGVPRMGVEEINTITGGMPAAYGDATGGIISIVTSGPSSKFGGGVEMRTSQFLDPYGHNYLGFSCGGPILTKRDTIENIKKTVLGFFFSGELYSDKDGDPSAVGVWKINDEKLKELEENPLRPSKAGTGYVRNAEFIRKEDLVFHKAKENVAGRGMNLQGKIQYKPNNNLNITLGSTFNYGNGHGFIYQYALANSVNNPMSTSNTWRTYVTITQRFGTQARTQEEKEKSSSNVQNAYYTLQTSYTQTHGTTEDDSHKANLFNYGYIGQFDHHKFPFYVLDNGSKGTAYYLKSYDNQNLNYVGFTPGTQNPLAANWTKQFYQLNNSTTLNGEMIAPNDINSDNDILQGNALLNGYRPGDIYSLFFNTGRQYPSYAKSQNSQFRVVGSFSADVKKHAIQVGFEFEQRNERNYSINTIDLWVRMRQLANSHIAQLDTANPILVPELSGTYNYYKYNRKYDASKQTTFDKNLREKMGLPVNNTDWIDIDMQDPAFFSLNMFSPDDLIQQGNNLLSYQGYDYLGNKTKNSIPFEDYFTKRDGSGNFTRNVKPYQPIYMAGYIQDKFDYRDMKFNVGVRVDRFDANQKVLKDKYLLDEAKTAGEVSDINGQAVTHPGNIGSNYVVYVDDFKNPRNILGYRNGNTWYNAAGSEISGPQSIKSAFGIAPYLANPSNYDSAQKVSYKAFKDFVPQINVMPRISFAFPISDVANFFAHYDILTQRPKYGNQMNPFNYLYLQENGGAAIANPDLKPEKTIDYELGYSQKLSHISAITISAYYKLMRDMIAGIKVTGAYPLDYFTLGNLDFGTVKGFSFNYDLRRTKGVQFNLNYTLQFAEGTASGASEGFNVAASGQPNLRTLAPLDIDQRHTINCNFDYRFGGSDGDDYRGPVWTKKKGDSQKTIQLLKDAGISIQFKAGSGTPYTRQSNVLSAAGGIGGTSASLKGTIRGSSKPFTYLANIRFDKNFEVKWNSKDEENGKKSNLNVYIQVLNVLNTKNVLGVWAFTGNPDNDGYLQSPAAQATIAQQNDPTSFKELYSIYVNNPNNYSNPRRIRLGIILNF